MVVRIDVHAVASIFGIPRQDTCHTDALFGDSREKGVTVANKAVFGGAVYEKGQNVALLIVICKTHVQGTSWP